jgi:hypothetical protein
VRVVLIVAAALSLASCDLRPLSAPKPAETLAQPAKTEPSRPLASVYPDAKTVRLFVKSRRLVNDNTEVQTTWLNPAGGYRLSDGQARRLRMYLNDAPVNEQPVACFVPHHFFRFYDRTNQQVGEVAVCFCCAGVDAKPLLVSKPGRELHFDYAATKTLVAELGAKVDVECEGEV